MKLCSSDIQKSLIRLENLHFQLRNDAIFRVSLKDISEIMDDISVEFIGKETSLGGDLLESSTGGKETSLGGGAGVCPWVNLAGCPCQLIIQTLQLAKPANYTNIINLAGEAS